MSAREDAWRRTYRLRFPYAEPGRRPSAHPACEVEVRSSAPEMDPWITRLFSPFLRGIASGAASPPDGGDGEGAAFQLARDARARGGGPPGRLRLKRPGQRSTSASRPAEMAAYLECSVFEHVAWSLKGYFQFHAAFVAKGGRGALIPGRTGIGKTTLALLLWRAGWTVFADDLSLLDPVSGRFFPLPRPFHLLKETLALLRPPASGRALRVGPPDLDEPSAYFHPSWLPGAEAAALPKPVGARWVVFPRRAGGKGKKPALRPLRPSEAMRRLVPHAFGLQDYGVRGLEILSDLVSRTEPFELRMGSPEDTCRLADEAFGGAGP